MRSSVEKRRRTFSAASKAGRTVGLAFCLLIPVIAAGAHAWLTYGSSGYGFIPLLMAVVMFASMVSLVAKTDASKY